MKNEIERERNWRELPGYMAWICRLSLFMSIYGGTLMFFVRLVWLMVLEALFSKLRFRIICQMKCRVSWMKFYYFSNPIMFLSRKIFVSFLQNV